jgi:four helix bundle protein
MTNVNKMDKNKKFDIYERTFNFAVKTNQFLREIDKHDLIAKEYVKQLIRSSGSIGANLEEADGTLTKKDFINRVGISRREASESRYWLKLLKETLTIRDKKKLDWLIQECTEIILILSTIIKKTKLNTK